MSRPPLSREPGNPEPRRSGNLWRVEMTALGHAPFDGREPFVVQVRAVDRPEAFGRAGRLLKRTYGDGTPKGNPMWWRSEAVQIDA